MKDAISIIAEVIDYNEAREEGAIGLIQGVNQS